MCVSENGGLQYSKALKGGTGHAPKASLVMMSLGLMLAPRRFFMAAPASLHSWILAGLSAGVELE